MAKILLVEPFYVKLSSTIMTHRPAFWSKKRQFSILFVSIFFPKNAKQKITIYKKNKVCVVVVVHYECNNFMMGG